MVGKTNSGGPLGILFTPNVDIDGNLSWTNNGELENPPVRNLKGPKGDPGRSGVDLGAYVTPTATGTIASFDDGADDLPVKSLMVDIDPAQSGSGEPSPTNVRPISGWTGAKLTRSGKNLLPVVVKTTSEKGVTFDRRADGTVHVYGTTIPGERAYGYFDVPNSNIKGGCSYVIGGCPATGSMETYCLGVQWVLNGALKFGNWEWGQGLSTPFVIPEGATYVQVFVRVGWDTTLDVIFEPTIQLADNSSAGFEPYSADTYNISFPAEAGTVYGGTLDVINGVLTVNNGSAPGTYQLTPIEVKTMLGANNIWADTGDVSVSYRADPTIIYNKLTAAIISSGGAV